MRKLPKHIIREGNHLGSLEVQKIIEKYSQSSATIKEDAIDYAALGYMTPEATLYWLPTFFDYLETEAEPDSFHFEIIGQKMVNQSWVVNLKNVATKDEIQRVKAFLLWLGDQPYVDHEDELSSAAYHYAVALWNS